MIFPSSGYSLSPPHFKIQPGFIQDHKCHHYYCRQRCLPAEEQDGKTACKPVILQGTEQEKTGHRISPLPYHALVILLYARPETKKNKIYHVNEFNQPSRCRFHIRGKSSERRDILYIISSCEVFDFLFSSV